LKNHNPFWATKIPKMQNVTLPYLESDINLPNFAMNDDSIEYDESERCSDSSFDSDHDHATGKHIRETNELTKFKLPDSACYSGGDTATPADTPPYTLGANHNFAPNQYIADISKLEEICAKLRIKCSRYESELAEMAKNNTNLEKKTADLIESNNTSYHKIALLETQVDKLKQLPQRDIVHSDIVMVESTMDKVERELLNQIKGLTAENDRLRSTTTPEKIASTPPAQRKKSAVDLPDTMDQHWVERVNQLKAKHEEIVKEYEITVKNLRLMIEKSTRQTDKLIPPPYPDTSKFEEMEKQNKILKKRLSEYEARIESVKNYYILKLKKAGDSAVPVSQMMDSVPAHNPRNTRPLIVERTPVVTANSSFCGTDRLASSPPIPDMDIGSIGVADWMNMLHACVSGNRKRRDLQKELQSLDPSPDKVGLVSLEDFLNVLKYVDDDVIVNRIASIYAYGTGDMIDYKAFTSDIACRSGVFVVDLENQIDILKKHAHSLLKELHERMESIEKGDLIETLEIANAELQRRAEELAVMKKSLGSTKRHASRNIGLRIRE